MKHNRTKEIAAPIAEDLSRTEPTLLVTVGCRDGYPTIRIIDSSDDKEVAAASLSWGDFGPSPGEEIAFTCDRLQQGMIEILNRAWPVCPIVGHRHPVVPRVDPDDVAVWKCPVDIVAWPVGKLGVAP